MRFCPHGSTKKVFECFFLSACTDKKSFECIFCIVDLHAITIKQNPKELEKNTLEVTAAYLASGIDPETSTIVIQSHVPYHAELMWILNSITYILRIRGFVQFHKGRSW